MASAGSLHADERAVRDVLVGAGLTLQAATLATVLHLRKHNRPEMELFDQVSSYPYLDSEATFATALADLRSRGWIDESHGIYGGQAIIREAPDIAEKLIAFAPAIRSKLDAYFVARAHVEVHHMGDAYVYASYTDFLAGAANEIAHPLVMTSSNLSQIEILRERARAHVHVRVLLATPELAGEIRGQNRVSEAKERLKVWRQRSKGIRRFEVRVTRRRDDVRDGASVIVDGQVKYVIYDDASERASQGYVISRSGESNLGRMFSERFDEIWLRSRPLGIWPTFSWIAKRTWWTLPVGAAAFGMVAARDDHPVAVSLILGGMIGWGFERIDRVAAAFRRYWRTQFR